MKKQKINGHKATIETLINTIAIALTTYGVNILLQKDYFGFLIILFAMFLEFTKYWGRHRKLW